MSLQPGPGAPSAGAQAGLAVLVHPRPTALRSPGLQLWHGGETKGIVGRRVDLGLPRAGGECGITERGAPGAGRALRVTEPVPPHGAGAGPTAGCPGATCPPEAPSRGSPSGSPNKTRSSDCLVATTRINNYEQKDRNTKALMQLSPRPCFRTGGAFTRVVRTTASGRGSRHRTSQTESLRRVRNLPARDQLQNQTRLPPNPRS